MGKDKLVPINPSIASNRFAIGGGNGAQIWARTWNKIGRGFGTKVAKGLVANVQLDRYGQFPIICPAPWQKEQVGIEQEVETPTLKTWTLLKF